MDQSFTVIEGTNERALRGDPNTLHLWDCVPVLSGQKVGTVPEGVSIRVGSKTYTGDDIQRTFADLDIPNGARIEVLGT